ncbi:MAG: hypothetical protein EOP86_23880, partial [Verrucomicrobiaceae bacterium]
FLAGAASTAPADELGIGRTPVLSGNLPTATSWQVEIQQAGGAWTGTGVMVAGRGADFTLRMDGWPDGASYRFQRVDGGLSVPATVAAGWHLAGRVTDPVRPPVLIQDSENLGTWSPRQLVFPDLDRSFVRGLDSLTGPRGFFRSAPVAAGVVREISATTYTSAPPYNGEAGYGPIYADMPQIYKDGYVSALHTTDYNRGGLSAGAAGECYELVSAYGRTTVMIHDSAPSAPAGTISAGRGYFDLGAAPFNVLSGGNPSGILTATARLVPAPVTGNVKLFVAPGSSIYYMALIPFNHRAGIDSIEILNNGSSLWHGMTRAAGGRFAYMAGGSLPLLSYPVQIRVTSRFGESVVFTSVSSLADNARITGPAQFTVFPEQAPVPSFRRQPVYQDSLSAVPGDKWDVTGFGGASVSVTDTAVKYAGTASLRMDGLSPGGGIVFISNPSLPRPRHGVLRMVVRAASPVVAGGVRVRITATNIAGGGSADSQTIWLPALTTGWQTVLLPLEASGAGTKVTGFVVNGGSAGQPSVWLDNVELIER